MFTLLAFALFQILLRFSVPICAISPGDPDNLFDWWPFGTAGPRPISDNLFHTFQLISQYAAASYCPGNNNSTDTFLTCPSGNCPQVEAAAAITLSEFEDTPIFDNTGYIAIDNVNKMVVLAIRGSISKQNWQADWNMLRGSTDFCDDCRIHRGFRNSWQEIRDAVMENMKRAVERHPGYRIVVTGHSLGGAVATIAAAELRRIDQRFAGTTELYSFGSPRIANKKAARWFSDQARWSWRITSENDVVPRLPPRFFGYHHTEPEFWISRNGSNPDPKDVLATSREDSSWGNEGEIIPSKKAHHHYFGDISACRPDKDD
ncbi:MAG: hypothetical protein Q9178_002578 [Gyalolechia marmorata]